MSFYKVESVRIIFKLVGGEGGCVKIMLFLCGSELAEPLGPVEPSELVLPSQPVEIEIETPEIRKRQADRCACSKHSVI